MKKRKMVAGLEKRQDAWQRSIDNKGRGAGIQTAPESFHKPGSLSGRK